MERGYPVTVNDAAFAKFVLGVSERVVGSDLTDEQPFPQMAAEDFSYILENVPGAMVGLGTTRLNSPEGRRPTLTPIGICCTRRRWPTASRMYAAVALEFLGDAS